MSSDGLFAVTEEFPNERAHERYLSLVGLEANTRQLLAEARVLLDPASVDTWSRKMHKTAIPAVADLIDRTPLVVLAGDVGTGKTELAETVGDAIARELGIKVMLYPLSLSIRGHGAVGEMTSLLTKAFETVHELMRGARSRDGRLRHGAILLVDEADALAQSRELAQMHHEDRAGVNALIRGIDGVRKERLPVLTIMCTNRVNAIDPAVRRRAAAVLTFSRPKDADREAILQQAFTGVAISAVEMADIVRLTGPVKDAKYGCTYSDLRQRFIPSAVIQAVDAGVPITGRQLIDIATTFIPTRPFGAEQLDD